MLLPNSNSPVPKSKSLTHWSSVKVKTLTLQPSIPQKTRWLLQKKLESPEAPCPVEQWTLLHRWKTTNPKTVH